MKSRTPNKASTASPEYAKHLEGQQVWWKRWLDVQRPYRIHLRALKLGNTLEVGCGIGRNLAHLAGTGTHVGVDHNLDSIAVARSRGLDAWTAEDFSASSLAQLENFDSLLFSHVLEHLAKPEAKTLVTAYLPYLRRGGTIVIITPQEWGFRSDPTHVSWVDWIGARSILELSQTQVVRQYSFPLPRFMGRAFKYNEFVTLGRKL